VAQVVDGGAVTRVVGLDRALAFQPVTEAADILADLMAGWREGLTRPLPLFPRAGHAYVEQARNPKARSDPLAKAQAAWAGGDFQRGACDRDDPYVACCFRGGDPLRERGEEFIALAHRLWEPLFDAMADAP
jgi:exodeoxyribonuclease V gamma subunit